MKCLAEQKCQKMKRLNIVGRKLSQRGIRMQAAGYQLNWEVKLMLLNQSNEKEVILYNANPYYFKISKIGFRPPYYCNPRYEQYYSVI